MLSSGPDFPRNPNGDVTISLNEKPEDDLILRYQDLARMCGYFRGIGGAARFRLLRSEHPKECVVVPVSRHTTRQMRCQLVDAI